MKKIVMCASALLALTVSGASAGEIYGQVSAGPMFVQDKTGTIDGDDIEIEYQAGWSVFGSAGYKFDQGFRLEGELGYGRAEYDGATVNGAKVDVSGDLDLISLTANAFYDFKTATRFSPYVGAGLGAVHSKISNVQIANQSVPGATETDFTMLGEAGINYMMSQKVAVGLGYRYTHLFNGTDGMDDDAAHTFKLNGRLSF